MGKDSRSAHTVLLALHSGTLLCQEHDVQDRDGRRKSAVDDGVAAVCAARSEGNSSRLQAIVKTQDSRKSHMHRQ